MLAYQPSFEEFYHTRTRTYTRKKKPSSRDQHCPSIEEIGGTIIARLSSLTSFLREKIGKNRAKHHTRFFFRHRPRCTHFRIYKKSHVLRCTRECGIIPTRGTHQVQEKVKTILFWHHESQNDDFCYKNCLLTLRIEIKSLWFLIDFRVLFRKQNISW